ncbi:histone deacetylase [Rubellicoccus peritrichatus]|uniref:Histone deacetylase n=1 Tax=Rubellicoccus peritrichatus TaxID=3080537 RepID=A0AAQ3L761_9BACT|nr:histone deacetylase [Puniceicoccus sp. CR14]WOO40271.1 histone deacetylase [Puniceicoccus sp. CR14]
MEKFPEAHDIIVNKCAEIEVIHVEPASMEQLLCVHDRKYLEAIRDGKLTRYDRNRLGLPHDPRLLERSAMETSGTIQAAEAALKDGIAANLAGGTHHAFANRGLGFCVLNDIAVSIVNLRHRDPELHVMVIDTDAHQGNGTHALLREDLFAFTYSIHVGKNYPAQKEPGDYDVPLPRWVEGAEYLRSLEKTLPETFHRAEPDLIYWIAGADLHIDDRFGQMKLTEADMATRDAFVLDLVRCWEIPVVILYGGGYNRSAGMTARLHANTVLMAQQFTMSPQ